MGAGCSSNSPPTAADPRPVPNGRKSSADGPVASKAALVAGTGPSASTGTTTRKLTILHFNDIYNIEEQARDPKGGAARLCAKVKEFRQRGANPLVLFSGDAYNPSVMSTITLGKQMVDVLNEIGVNVSCVGNHDFDYGVENLKRLNAQCQFPWLMANVLEKGTDVPYGGVDTTWIQDWNGIKVGIVGLVEEEWLETLGAVNVEEMEYRNFYEVGRAAAQELKEQGAELLIALTHMREDNDRKLAAELSEFHLVLGGHDHHYVSGFIEPHNNLLVKSGTDFRDLSVVEVEFAEGSKVPKLSVDRIAIDSSVPEDPEMKAIVEEHMKLMGEKLSEPLGETLEPLDGRFQTVRNRESNLGNFVTDVWRKAAKADIVISNSGAFRSDMIHPVGTLTAKDFVSILPIVAGTVVLECTGAQVLEALENGVSQWPKLEGRFPQVSGIMFKFDPNKEPGQRIVPGCTYVTSLGPEPVPLELERKYRVAASEYLATGKDGFHVFEECKVLVDAEAGVVVPSALKYFFIQMQVINQWESKKVSLEPLASKWLRKAETSKLEEQESGESQTQRRMKAMASGRKRTQGLTTKHPILGHMCIAPFVEGRIINVLEEADLPTAATAAAEAGPEDGAGEEA